MTKHNGGGIKRKAAGIIEHPGSFVSNIISRLFLAIGAAIVLTIFNRFVEPVKVITGWLKEWIGDKFTTDQWNDMVLWTHIGFYTSFMLALMPMSAITSISRSKMKM